MFNRHSLLRLLVSCLLFHAVAAVADGLDIYLVRHAQTEANASGVNDKHTSSTFSNAGQSQIRQLTDNLMKYKFDAVLVSPTERTLYTIAPYLKVTGTTGVIWPEIAECCWQKDQKNQDGGHLVWGEEVRLPPEIAAQFSFRDGIPARGYANRSYADGIEQLRQAATLIKDRYCCSGKSILVVTHYHAGALLMAQLLGMERGDLPSLENTGIAHLRQGADGRYSLLMINGRAR